MMVPLMKNANIIDSAVFTFDIGSGADDSSIYFGGWDEENIKSEDLIHWNTISNGKWWDAPLTGFGYGCIKEFSGIKVVFISLDLPVKLPQPLF